MPLPPDLPDREELCLPDLPNPVTEPAHLILSLHYAIKGPQNQRTETILQTFDHVTEGTVVRSSLSTSLNQALAHCLT